MNTKIYTPFAIHEILNANGTKPVFGRISKNSPEYLETPISFDIETSNIRNDKGEKRAFMYVWMLDIFDCTIIGRTWSEFVDVLQIISQFFALNPENRRAIIYVHNLAYEFQFMRKHIDWYKIFATEKRKPLYAISDNGIEFRCSLRLSGYRLEKVGEMLKNPIEKKVGDLDYTKVRTRQTVLTPSEYGYCINDVKVVSEYIREKIAEESGIENIPMTKTGYVRRMCKHRTLHGKNYGQYIKLMQNLTLSPDEYRLAKSAFMGGFTHANFTEPGKP